MTKTYQARGLTLATTAVLAFLMAACSKTPPPVEPIRAVKVLSVGVEAVSSGYEYAGEVRAQLESRVGFRVGGKIIKRQAELGQRVKAGQVLAQLDPQDYRLAADAARALQRAAATNRDLAAADFKRYKELKDQNFISSAELERRETTLKAAQAQYEQTASQLAVQSNQASYATLVADVSGVITAVEAEPGQVVAAGAPVVRIAADGARDVVFAVPEDRVALFKPGLAVTVRGWSQAGSLGATVREVAASADPVTRTYPVKVTLSSGAAAPPLGATVYVLPLAADSTGAARPQVIKLPTSALWRDGQTSAVWVLDKASMTVKPQAVQVATADGNDVVIAAGLQPGALVVSAGVHVLSPGQKVTIYQPKVAVVTGSIDQTAINSGVSVANPATSAAVNTQARPAAAASQPAGQ